jgi:hypothetical protein
MAAPSRPRLSVDSVSRMPSMQSFGELSQFLRAAAADEESLQVSDSMSQLVAHTEAIVGFLASQAPNSDGAARLDPLLTGLMAALRNHLHMLEGLGGGWQSHFEYRSYKKALKHFIGQVEQWLRQVRDPEAPALSPVAFEVNAWRVLGMGALLIDVHDQPLSSELEPAAEPRASGSLVARAWAWLARRLAS